MTTALIPTQATPVGGGTDALLATARSEVLLMSTQVVPAPSPLGLARGVHYENLRRGVRYRILVPDGARIAPLAAHQLAKLAQAGATIRTVPDVPSNAVFVDRAIAAFPADRGPAVIRLPGVVSTAIELFELLWPAAAPLVPSELPNTAALVARERKLLSLLSMGYTDEAAADELNISVRTVRRLVSSVMNRLGARSRFMAGIKVAERGWLAEQAA